MIRKTFLNCTKLRKHGFITRFFNNKFNYNNKLNYHNNLIIILYFYKAYIIL